MVERTALLMTVWHCAAMLLAFVLFDRPLAMQVEQVIDLVAADRAHKIDSVAQADRMTAPPTIIASHPDRQPPPAPFRVTLLSFDAAGYSRADLFTFEVRLENLSSAPIDVPVSVDNSRFRRDVPGTRSMSITLKSDPPTGAPRPLTFEDTYGSPSVAGSLVTVPPGGSIRFRGQGGWDTERQAPAGADLALRASVAMWIVGREVYQPVDSIVLAVQLRDR